MQIAGVACKHAVALVEHFHFNGFALANEQRIEVHYLGGCHFRQIVLNGDGDRYHYAVFLALVGGERYVELVCTVNKFLAVVHNFHILGFVLLHCAFSRVE